MAGMACEAYKFVGKHEWLIPVFLFRNHEDAGQYIYTLNRDPDRQGGPWPQGRRFYRNRRQRAGKGNSFRRGRGKVARNLEPIGY